MFLFGFVTGFAVWASAMLGAVYVAAFKYGQRRPE